MASVQNGATYDVTIWVKVSSSQQITPKIVTDSSISGWQTFDPNSTSCTAGVRMEVTSTITPSWSGTLNSASLKIGTQTSHEFWIDDASLVEQGGGGPSVMEYLPGSRRRLPPGQCPGRNPSPSS